ncbi:uncharacterized protein LOC131882467 [Tigriopus californicus]|uniref:uncharacterized protein LOC131882467 n=1 Tax=Tigriopus californicus TaxID=6832 RepID=UPI0027DAB49C|nr:uncharacterized protein LOC131882467 [Tigriopus californicus]
MPFGLCNAAQTFQQLASTNYSVGAVLEQDHGRSPATTGDWCPVAFFSKTMTDTERRYSAFDRELLAVKQAVRKFRHILNGISPTHLHGRQGCLIEISEVSSLAVDIAAAQAFDPELADSSRWLPYIERDANANGSEILVDTRFSRRRPLFPVSVHKATFKAFHKLAHAGVAATKRLLANRRPSDAFKGLFYFIFIFAFIYLFTVVDRFTRWPEAIPMPDAKASTCARAFSESWIARFGVPSLVVSDWGAQLVSNLWHELAMYLGYHVKQTCAYHPAANGIVEQFHCQLKRSLKARLETCDGNWTVLLHAILLGLRSAVKSDLGYSPAELVYDAPLNLPNAYFQRPTTSTFANVDVFVDELRPSVGGHVFTPAAWHRGSAQGTTTGGPPRLLKGMDVATHVWERVDLVRRPLECPYRGLYRVVSWNDKFFVVLKNGAQASISMERLKPAFGPLAILDPPSFHHR